MKYWCSHKPQQCARDNTPRKWHSNCLQSHINAHPPQVEAKALGLEVMSGVTPQVQFVKVVNDELVELMGSAGSKDLEAPAGGDGPQVVLLAGLQGVGKTTAAGKLAAFLAKRRKKVRRVGMGWLTQRRPGALVVPCAVCACFAGCPRFCPAAYTTAPAAVLPGQVLLVATDVYRPAAIDQLVKLGSKIDVPVYEEGTQADPVEIAARGVEKAKAEGYDAVIIDTAGRLQVGGAAPRGNSGAWAALLASAAPARLRPLSPLAHPTPHLPLHCRWTRA